LPGKDATATGLMSSSRLHKAAQNASMDSFDFKEFVTSGQSIHSNVSTYRHNTLNKNSSALLNSHRSYQSQSSPSSSLDKIDRDQIMVAGALIQENEDATLDPSSLDKIIAAEVLRFKVAETEVQSKEGKRETNLLSDTQFLNEEHTMSIELNQILRSPSNNHMTSMRGLDLPASIINKQRSRWSRVNKLQGAKYHSLNFQTNSPGLKKKKFMGTSPSSQISNQIATTKENTKRHHGTGGSTEDDDEVNY